MWSHVVLLISYRLQNGLKTTQKGPKYDSEAARIIHNLEETQGETGNKPQKPLKKQENDHKSSKTIKTGSKTTQKHSKTTQNDSKHHQNQAKGPETPLPSRGIHIRATSRIQAVSQGSRSSRNSQNDSKTSQNHSKRPKITKNKQKPLKMTKIHSKSAHLKGPDPALR